MPVQILDPVSKKRLIEAKREKLRRSYPKLWLAKYHHLNVHSKRMVFTDKFRFIVELYKVLEEGTPLCFEKSVQSGLSEMFLVSALEEAARGLRILYVMPNIDLRGKFVKDRLDPLLKTVALYREYFREAIGTSQAIGMKHFGMGVLNFVGSSSPADFVSFPGDSLYVDEVDKCDQKNLEMAPDRLDASDYKYERYVGNPSIEKWGIDSHFQISSQALWNLKCEHCGYTQALDFFSNVVSQIGEIQYELIVGTKTNPKIVCARCEKEIDRLGLGEWIHKYPSVEKKGYRINQLFSANVKLSSLVNTFFKALGNDTKLQLFYNSKLGIPYSSEGSKITFNSLENASDKGNYILKINDPSFARKDKNVHVGIDVGKYYNIIARAVLPNGMRRLVFIGKVSETKTVVNLMKALHAKKVVIDKNPETREVENMKRVLNRMYSCSYSLGKTLLDINKGSHEYQKEHEVRIDRTFILDSVKEGFSTDKMINPKNARDLDNADMEDYGDYYSHMMASTRVFDEDKGRYEWRETSPDHYHHAEGYCFLAGQIDDRVLDYYTSAVSEVEGESTPEMEANIKKKKKMQDLIPRTETGEVDVEKASLVSAQSFLNNLTDHNEDIVGVKKQPKRRCDVDD